MSVAGELLARFPDGSDAESSSDLAGGQTHHVDDVAASDWIGRRGGVALHRSCGHTLMQARPGFQSWTGSGLGSPSDVTYVSFKLAQQTTRRARSRPTFRGLPCSPTDRRIVAFGAGHVAVKSRNAARLAVGLKTKTVASDDAYTLLYLFDTFDVVRFEKKCIQSHA